LELLLRSSEADSSKRKTEAIAIAREAAGEHPTPGTWDAALYLPYTVWNDLLGRFVGTEIACDLRGVVGMRIVLTGIKISGEWGNARVDLNLRAQTSLSGDSAELVTTGRLLYCGYAEKESGTVSAVFRIDLDPPSQTEKTGAKTFLKPGWLTQLVATGAMKLLEDQLTFALPVPVNFAFPLGYDEETTIRANDEGWVKVHVTAAGATLRQRVERFAPIFVPSGLWLCLQFQGSPKTEVAAAPTKIEDALANYDKEGGDQAKLIVHGKFLEGIVNGLGELSEEARTAKASIIDDGGRLFHSGGDVYAAVWLQNHDGGASLTVNPSAEWKTEGLEVTVAYQALARANLHVHVDPGISGGVGTSVGSRGSSGGIVKGTMKTMLLCDNECLSGKVLALRPDFRNQELRIEMTTDGRLKLEILGGWESIRVPSFGVRTILPVPHNVLPSIPLLTDAPCAIDLSVSKKLPPGLAITLPQKTRLPTHLVIEPTEPTGDPLGYVMPFTVRFDNFTSEEVRKRTAAVDAVLRSEAQPKIEVGKIDVLFAGFAFGSNNEIIKAVANTVETLHKTGKDVEHEVARTADNVEAQVENGAKNTEREVGKFVTHAEREVGNTGGNVAKTTTKAARDIKGAGKKVDKWRRKTLGF
jgi:hypothetical protein